MFLFRNWNRCKKYWWRQQEWQNSCNINIYYTTANLTNASCVCALIQYFLTSEGKDRDIQEVKTLLNKVKHYLPKASINHLNSRVRDQEAELQRLIAKCQKREKELSASLQQLSRYGTYVVSDI